MRSKSHPTVDTVAFAEACRLAREPSREGIGTLSERVLHRALKLYIEPNAAHHEQDLCGCVVDILNSDGVTEVQTRSLDRLAPKLKRLLPTTPVTVVYPIAIRRSLAWIDPTSGESTKPRTAPRKGRPSDALTELCSLTEFLRHENLRVLLFLISTDEFKEKSGKGKDGKKWAQRLERIPTALHGIIELVCPEDYLRLLPDSLLSSLGLLPPPIDRSESQSGNNQPTKKAECNNPTPDQFTTKAECRSQITEPLAAKVQSHPTAEPQGFTAAEFYRATALRTRRAYYALKLLCDLGVLKREKRGRAYYYMYDMC